MILRYTRLLEPINQYITKTNLLYLKLRKIEVQQVQYLIDLVKPFCAFTQAISRTTTPTIQQVFPIYNTLLSHLDQAQSKLLRKKTAWKESLRSGIRLAKDKLKQYYAKTKGSLGHLYGQAILLTPHLKSYFFKGSDWTGGDTEWEDKYWESLKERYDEDYAHLPAAEVIQERSSFHSTDPLSMLLGDNIGEDEEEESAEEEFDRYRDQSKYYGYCSRYCSRQLTNIK